jgi:hypothetical protein
MSSTEPTMQEPTFEINRTYIHIHKWYDDNLGSTSDSYYYKIIKKTSKTVWWVKVFENGEDFTSNYHGEKMSGKSLIKLSEWKNDYVYYFDTPASVRQYSRVWCKNIQP